MITVYSYAIQILTTNRRDSLHGTNSSLQSMSAYGTRSRYLSLSTPDVIQCAIRLDGTKIENTSDRLFHL